jgi:hypothetical protein
MNSTQLDRVEIRLLSLLLVGCGSPPEEVGKLLVSGAVSSYLSGSPPITVFRLGQVSFPFQSDPHQTLLGEMRFTVAEKAAQWMLLRYPSGECEVEALVNGGSEPWVSPAEVPAQLEVLFGKEVV